MWLSLLLPPIILHDLPEAPEIVVLRATLHAHFGAKLAARGRHCTRIPAVKTCTLDVHPTNSEGRIVAERVDLHPPPEYAPVLPPLAPVRDQELVVRAAVQVRKLCDLSGDALLAVDGLHCGIHPKRVVWMSPHVAPMGAKQVVHRVVSG